MTNPMFYSSRPSFKVEGRIQGQLERDISLLEVEETVDGLKTLMARFTAIGPIPGRVEPGLLYLDGTILDFGKNLQALMGPPQDRRGVFDGYVSAIEVQYEEGTVPEVVIHAEDRLMDLRMTRRMRTYENMSDGQIAERIAQDHGLTARVEADGPRYDVTQQLNMSDLAFLRERGRLIQAEVWVEGNELHFKTRGHRPGSRVSLTRGGDILRACARADLSAQRTSVRVSGYDARTRTVIDETVGEEAVTAEAPRGRTGPSALKTAFGDRVSFRAREVPLNGAEARDWARAEMLRRCRSFVSVNGVTDGTPALGVGSALELSRMGAAFDGDGYYVTRARHVFDLDNGYRTHFEAERPTMRGGND